MYPPTNELDIFADKFGFKVEGYYMSNPPIASGWSCSREQLAKMIQAIVADEREACIARDRPRRVSRTSRAD